MNGFSAKQMNGIRPKQMDGIRTKMMDLIHPRKMMMGIHPKQARGFIDFLRRLLSSLSLLPHVSQRATSDPITFPRGLQRMPASKSSVPPKVSN
jgi:hypothetical protein